jgi:uncharacterized SAM-binding protein YcdF (DUF218 family)
MIRRIISSLILIWLLGFIWFALFLPQPLGNWRTDGIVVFTGGPHRIDRALDLLQEGQARRVLVSGVAPDVRPADLAAEYRRPLALIECCVALGRQAVDTRSNGTEVADWVRRRGYRSIRLVTTDWHMRRARYEVDRVLPRNITIVADAVPSRPSITTLWVEYHKLLFRRIGALFGL